MMIRRCDRCKQKIDGGYLRIDCANADTEKFGMHNVTTSERLDLCPKCMQEFKRFMRMEVKPHDED